MMSSFQRQNSRMMLCFMVLLALPSVLASYVVIQFDAYYPPSTENSNGLFNKHRNEAKRIVKKELEKEGMKLINPGQPIGRRLLLDSRVTDNNATHALRGAQPQDERFLVSQCPKSCKKKPWSSKCVRLGCSGNNRRLQEEQPMMFRARRGLNTASMERSINDELKQIGDLDEARLEVDFETKS